MISEDPKDKYGLSPSPRLLPLSINPPSDHPLKNIMNEGFIFCDMKVESSLEFDKNHEPEYNNKIEANVILKKTDNVYVFDQSEFDNFKNNWFDKNPNETKMTNVSYKEALIVKAKTLIHINKYKINSYKRPVIAICRYLSFDEIYISINQINEGRKNG